MPVDTSSYPTAPPPANPLATLSGVAGIQNTLNQNKLFQQQFQTNKAVSNIYKQAINPDGTIDQDKLTGLLASDPNASYGLPEAYKGSQEATQRNISIDSAKLQNARQHLEALGQYIGPLMKLGPKATSSDVVQAISHATTVGLASPQEAANVFATLPRTQDGRVDEAQIPAWVQQQQLNVMTAHERLDAMSPAPTMVGNGQQQIPMRLPQIGDPTQAGPGIQNQLPPNTPVFANGQPGYLGPQGGGGGQPGGDPGGQGGTPGGGMLPSGPKLGQSAAADVDAHAAAQQGVNLQQRADQVPNSKAILGNLQGDLGDFTSGPGTDYVAKLEKLVNANLGLKVDVEGLAAREKFNKLSGMLAQSQFQALGGTGTDRQLDSTTLTSPNSELSKLGNKGIIAMLKGNEDAISVKNQAWQNYKQQNGPESYGKFSTEFNKSYDPRVFQSQYLDPQDNKKMISGMTKTEQKTFLNSYRTALSQGWVKLPGAQ